MKHEMTTKSFKDIEDYGIIGNLETCALVGKDGSIDWLCFPYLESPSVFAAILDVQRGGHFCIRPLIEYESVQSYIKHTNILETKFFSALGEVIITDFMEVKGRDDDALVRSIFRKVVCTKGQMQISVNFKPAFNYARKIPTLEILNEGVLAQVNKDELFLQSAIPFNIYENEAQAQASLQGGQTLWFVLQYGHRSILKDVDCKEMLEKVKKHWLGWSERSLYAKVGRGQSWQDIIVRSGLVLKLLANPQTGSIAAAATTSLPERIGGVRNWDYRYAWIRDASFTAQALFHLGHVKESIEFRKWIWDIIDRYDDPSDIKIMYGLHSEMDIQEHMLENLCGYKDSSPVRVGNGAVNQKQLDIFGELLNMVYETTRYGEEITHKRWQNIKAIVDYVCKIWDKKDSGIWEVRGGPQHFVYSKLMCWVAINRALQIAKFKNYQAPLEVWHSKQEEIKDAILQRGFSKKLNSFVQSFDSEVLDATSLLIPLMGLLPINDEKVQGTIQATRDKLMAKDGLIYRYQAEDGLPGAEGHFILCSFWLIKVLALSGKVAEAEKIFLNILEYISPLGLFAEEIDSTTGKQLGNFPQAFSHIGLINSALYLGIAKGKEFEGPKPIGLL